MGEEVWVNSVPIVADSGCDLSPAPWNAYSTGPALAGHLNLLPGAILSTEAGPVFAAHTGLNALGAAVIRA
jgi:fatty acid-binding protein DegV